MRKEQKVKNSIMVILLFVLLIGNLPAQYPGGNALHFDGVDDYVEISDSPNLDVINNLTISIWIYGNNYEVNDLFVHKINAYGISIREGGELALVLSQDPSGINWGEFLANFVPSAGEWSHFAATYDALTQEVKLFVNGDLKNTAVYSESIANSNKALYFGGYFGGQNHHGIIDEIRIWNVTRTQAQIQSSMNDTLDPQYYSTSDSGLVGYWRFDEGTPGGDNTGVTTVPDLSPNGNHGTLNNFALTGDSSNWVNSDVPPTSVHTVQSNLPHKTRLAQNYPNPFNPSTKIKFTLPKAERVKIDIYNTIGQNVRTIFNKKMKAGIHEIEFKAQNLTSGVYYYKIKAGEFQDVKKMVLLK